MELLAKEEESLAKSDLVRRGFGCLAMVATWTSAELVELAVTAMVAVW